MTDRIEARRILGDPGDDRALREVQVPHVLVEILPRRGFYPVGSRSEIDGVEVILEDQVLIADPFLQLQGEILLLHLALERVEQSLLLRPSREHIVLKKLLRDRTGSLRKTESVRGRGDKGS